MSSVAAADSPRALAPPRDAVRVSRPRERVGSWPLIDRAAYVLCWAVGIGLCAVTAWIVLFMLIKGFTYIKPSLLIEHPAVPKPGERQSTAGGFLDPIEGTLLLSAIGIAIAAPAGVAIGVWLSEHQRPGSLARAVESGVETLSGAPSVLLALFGLALFARPVLAFMSQTSAGGSISGKSFLTAGSMMSLIALPLVVTATREALAQVPGQVREASYALGKTKSTTIRRVLLPMIRPSIASGTMLGIGRIVGDTAIVVILLSASMRLSGAGGLPVLSTLRGEGGTLTSYVRFNSPAGEGNTYGKAYAAAFVLLFMVLTLNVLAAYLGRTRAERGPGALRSITRRLGWTRTASASR